MDGKNEELVDVCTKDFISSMDMENVCFGKKIFWIEKGYMENIQKIRADEMRVYVRENI